MRNFKKFGLILTILFIISLSAVSAADISMEDSDSLSLADNSIDLVSQESSDLEFNSSSEVELSKDNENNLYASDSKSFSDLNDDILNAESVLEITSDYKFDDSTDSKFIRGINITNKTLIINGNNHVLDTSGKASVFTLRNSQITINNLTFINAHSTAISTVLSVLNTNGCLFKDSDKDRSAVLVGAGIYHSTNDKFINNAYETASAIISLNSRVIIDNGLFMSNETLRWGLVYNMGGILNVYNSSFENTTSRYSTGIYSTGPLNVVGCTFKNLYAKATAGAIGVKNHQNVTIRDSKFLNVSSLKNGGAVFIDVDEYVGNGTILINNTCFNQCSSEFGGAVMVLGGSLNVLNSNFSNNSAASDGGAIYLSYVVGSIKNSLFEGNLADIFHFGFYGGGAIFIDESEVNVTENSFINNFGSLSGGIYTYHANYLIQKNLFKNNGYAIYTVVDQDSSVHKSNTYEGDRTKTNLILIGRSVETNVKELVLDPLIIDASPSDSNFDLRDWGIVPPVKNQGNMGACWAFAATSAIESAFLKATGILLNLSENNVQNVGLRYSPYGKDSLTEGGYPLSALGYFLSGYGLVSSEDDKYDELGKVSSFASSEESYHLLDGIIIPSLREDSNKNNLKEALINYGAISVFLYGANSQEQGYYNPDTASQYYAGNISGNHFVTLVGWDDNYSKDNFLNAPPGDGAWICKNSWGTEWGKEGYFYVSYYDTSFASQESVAYLFNNTNLYDKVYGYDKSAFDKYKEYKHKVIYADLFEAEGNEMITAVGTYFKDAGVKYQIGISVNDEEVYSDYIVAPFSGYHTIDLKEAIHISKGDNFLVLVESKAVPVLTDTRQLFYTMSSFLFDGDNRIDLSNNGIMACIKAYVVKSNDFKSSSTVYSKGKYTVNIGYPNKKVVLELNKKNYTLKSNGTGDVVLNLPALKVGYAVIKIHVDNGTIADTVAVKTRFTASNLVMDYNDGSKFKVRVRGYDGKFIKVGVKVTMTLNKKTYTLKTDKNGYATLKVPNTLKPGKYTITFKYMGETAKRTITVKQVLKTSKVTVKKTASKITLKATLRTSKNKAIASKKVSFKFYGKTYSAKTNSKGIVSVSISKSVLNKLKKGKTYAFTVTYVKDTIKSTVAVK